MRAPSPRLRKIAGLSAGPIAVLVAGALVWQGSTAAFTATTGNTGNSWAAGQVTLTDDDQGRAAFEVDNLTPGESGENCITVTSNSTVPGTVKAYVAKFESSGEGLGDRLKIVTARGTGGGWGDCTGFVRDEPQRTDSVSLLDLSRSVNSYASGQASWDTTGTPGESKTYRISWTFDTAGMPQAGINTLQGATVSADVVWELQSNTPGS